MESTQFKDVPVSIFLSVSIIVVFSLYLTNAIKTIPCGNNVLSGFFSNFIHIEPYHLMANLFALYALSRVERNIGAKKFITLIVFLLIFNTIIEVALHKLFPKIPCSIGFSGVLFGIMTWELVTNQELDFILLVSIGAMVLSPSIMNPKASLLGHAAGAATGVIGALIWKKIAPNMKLNGVKQS